MKCIICDCCLLGIVPCVLWANPISGLMQVELFCIYMQIFVFSFKGEKKKQEKILTEVIIKYTSLL